MWVDDYSGATDGPDADALRAAAAEGRPVVVGLRADTQGAAEREAGRLAEELGGVTVCQRLAAGSLIGAEGAEAGDAVHFLVCVNLDEASVTAASSATDSRGGAAGHGVRALLGAGEPEPERGECAARARTPRHARLGCCRDRGGPPAATRHCA